MSNIQHPKSGKHMQLIIHFPVNARFFFLFFLNQISKNRFSSGAREVSFLPFLYEATEIDNLVLNTSLIYRTINRVLHYILLSRPVYTWVVQSPSQSESLISTRCCTYGDKQPRSGKINIFVVIMYNDPEKWFVLISIQWLISLIKSHQTL